MKKTIIIIAIIILITTIFICVYLNNYSQNKKALNISDNININFKLEDIKEINIIELTEGRKARLYC